MKGQYLWGPGGWTGSEGSVPLGVQGAILAVKGQYLWGSEGCTGSEGAVSFGGPGGCTGSEGQYPVRVQEAALAVKGQYLCVGPVRGLYPLGSGGLHWHPCGGPEGCIILVRKG